MSEFLIESRWEVSAEMVEKAYEVAVSVHEEMIKKQKEIAKEILAVLAKRA